MDPEVSLLLHCAQWRGLLQGQVGVELSDRFNRRTDAAVERHIEDVWSRRVSKEPWLFNGAKFRLHSFCFTTSDSTSSSCGSHGHPTSTRSAAVDSVEDCGGDSACRERREGQSDICLRNSNQNCLDQRRETGAVENVFHQGAASSTCGNDGFPQHCVKNKNEDQDPGPRLTLRLGLTCYKDYLGTNWSCRVTELRRRGETEFGDSLAMLAQPLGVGAILCTRDRQVVLIRRSQKVAEAAGLLDIPGGHPEPKVVCERLGLAAGEETDMATMQQRPEAVVSELFSSVCAEIRDEVNVPLRSLGQPVLMGVALNHTSAERPSAEFYVSSSLTSDDVRALYWEGGAEAHESTDIIFLSRTEVLQLNHSSPLWSELCPSAKGAVLLYQRVKPNGDWEQ